MTYLANTTSKHVLNSSSLIPSLMITKLMGSKYIPELAPLAPSYDELRDMFSEGQLASKLWLANSLVELVSPSKILIVGSWYGTLAYILANFEFFDESRPEITLLDIDPRCKQLLNGIGAFTEQQNKVTCITGDMYNFDYSGYDTIINTSCEHILHLKLWLDLIPDGKIVVLQSNNLIECEQHVACVENEEEFAELACLTKLHLIGKLECFAYNRFMLIGTK